MDVLEQLVGEYLNVTQQANDLDQRRAKLRELIMPLLDEAGGSYIDEASGTKLLIKRTPRYEYDPARLHKLVVDGLLREHEFAEALVTVVNKDAVKAWVSKGLITDRQLAGVDARIVTKVVEMLTTERVGHRARFR